jgi:arylsulfatase
MDLMPTALAAAGAEYPKTFAGHEIQPLEGVNLLPALRGETVQRAQPIFWEHEGNRAVRDGKWKLVSRFPGEWELYDMEADPTECADLAPARADQVRALAAKYDAWAERCNVRPWSLTVKKKAE